jgi:hypothetical protein
VQHSEDCPSKSRLAGDPPQITDIGTDEELAVKKLLIGLGGVILIVVILVVARVPRYDPGIRDWHDLHAVRYHLGKNYVLMNDLDATTAGYEELAGPWANGGKGWQPIGDSRRPFRGALDGQGHQIADLYINRPSEFPVGLLGLVAAEGEVRSLRVVDADVRGASAGLVVGTNLGVVSNCGSAGAVSGVSHLGGLVGVNAGAVSRSYSMGSVTGAMEYVGGLIGANRGTVSDSYSTARVLGETGPAGGLVGQNSGGVISNAYAAGSVSRDPPTGGLVGHHMGAVQGCFWDTQTSGTEESAGGTGKTTAEMKTKATFMDAGWDFDSIWDMNQINDGYPFLRWQLENR